jgi:hypothetical protein
VEQVITCETFVFRQKATDLVNIMYSDVGRCWCVNDFLNFGSKRNVLKLLNYLVSIGFVEKLMTYPKLFRLK